MPGGRLGGSFLSNASSMYDDAQYGFNAVAEPLLTFGSGALAEIGGGWAGLGAMPGAMMRGEDPLDAFRAASEGVQDRYTYQPQTAGGQAGMQAIGRGAQYVMDSKEAELIGASAGRGADWAIQNFPNAAPPLMAAGVGAAAVLDPTKGRARAAGRLTDQASTATRVAADTARERAVKSTGETGPFPWAAERYPELGEPLTQWKDKKNPDKGTYLGKASSEESKTFMAERARVTKRMTEEGFDPIFPPSERFDVDVSNYPATGNTLTDTLPAKPETAANWRDKIQTDEARANIAEAVRVGEEVGGGDRWYHMGQLEKAYVDELGEEAGRARFKEDFADSMAATTGGADPGGNLLSANYGNFQRGQGLPAPTKSYEIASPVGGRYIGGNMTMYNKVAGGEPLTAAGQPKRHNFSRNFLGDKGPSTIDEQMSQMIEGKNAPSAYYASEELTGGRDVQDVAWHGAKAQKDIAAGRTPAPGKPMIEWVNETVERTSQLTGLTPEEVLKRMINRQIPMYGLGGTAVIGGSLYDQEEALPERL